MGSFEKNEKRKSSEDEDVILTAEDIDENDESIPHIDSVPFSAYEGEDAYAFVSYSHKDYETVYEEIIRFNNQGLNVWYDEGIAPGNEWLEEIAEALYNSSLFIVFISKNSVESKFVRKEIKFAISKNIPFIAIHIEKTELPLQLDLAISDLQAIHKYGMRDAEYYRRYTKAFNKKLKKHGVRLKSVEASTKKKVAESQSDSKKPPEAEIEPEPVNGMEKIPVNLSYFPAYYGDEPYIFASYAHDDFDRIISDLNYFHDLGYYLAYDEGLGRNSEWDDQIAELLMGSSLFVVFISKNALNSIYVQDEIMLALAENIDIVPIYLEDVKLKPGLKSRLKDKPAILKYNSDEDDYLGECFNAFEPFKKKEDIRKDSKKHEEEDSNHFSTYDVDEPYLFVSYAHTDSNIVFPEIKRFQKMGYNVWYDEGIPTGSEWIDDIVMHIQNSNLFVVFITNNSVSSKNIINEINYALNKRKTVLPIFLEDTQLKPGLKLQLSSTQSIFKYKMNEDEYASKIKQAFENSGLKASDEGAGNACYSFEYLHELIHEADSNLIALDHDITFENNEIDFYGSGIKIYKEGIVIDGQNHFIDAGNMARIFEVCGKNIILKNITFKNAHFDSNGGALLLSRHSSLKIDSCKFENNSSKVNGGAITNSGNLSIVNSEFFNNRAENMGGAIFNENDGNLEIVNSDFAASVGLDAAAISNFGNLEIRDSRFDENTATDDAGAIGSWNQCEISNSVFNKNTANSASGNNLGNGGGALFNLNGVMSIDDCVFQDNFTKGNGGSINCHGGKMSIEKSIFMNYLSELKANSITLSNNANIIISGCSFNDYKDNEIVFDDTVKMDIINSKFKPQNYSNENIIEKVSDALIQPLGEVISEKPDDGRLEYSKEKLIEKVSDALIQFKWRSAWKNYGYEGHGEMPNALDDFYNYLSISRGEYFKKDAENIIDALYSLNFKIVDADDERPEVMNFSESEINSLKSIEIVQCNLSSIDYVKNMGDILKYANLKLVSANNDEISLEEIFSQHYYPEKQFSDLSDEEHWQCEKIAILLRCVAEAAGGEFCKRSSVSESEIVKFDSFAEYYDIFKDAFDLFIVEMINRGWKDGKYDFSNKTMDLSNHMKGTYSADHAEANILGSLKIIGDAGYVVAKK